MPPMGGDPGICIRVLRTSVAAPAWQAADLTGSIDGSSLGLVFRDDRVIIVVHGD